MANHLIQDFSISIITLVGANPFYELCPSVEIYRPCDRIYHQKFLRVVQQIWHVYRSLRKVRPAGCIIFGEDIAGVLCPVARLARVPRVYVANRGNPERSLRGILRWLNPISYRFADCVIVQTLQAVERLEPTYRKCCFKVIANPIIIPNQVPPILSRCRRVICVASIGREKNQKCLIDVFRNLPEPRDWKLVFAGDGPNRPILEDYVKQLGMECKIEFLGQRTDITDLLHDSQIFAFTSLAEGFPNALAEALAAGCACISFDCPTGPADLISDGVNGMLVPIGNEPLFTKRLQSLIDDECLRVKLSEQARRMIRQYGLAEILGKYRWLIER